jgi:hypothetical protein
MLCRNDFVALSDAVTITALGKILGMVHKDPCAKYLQTGVNVVSMLALKGLHGYLAVKAPKALAVIERVNQLRSQNS